MALKSDYMTFYLDGREERLLKHGIDVEEIAAKVLDGADLRATVLSAAETAAAPQMVDRKKRAWLEDFADEITAAGGDKTSAHEAYCKGRIDELAYVLEPLVVEAMSGEVSDGEGEDDEGDEDGDDGGDGD